MTSRRPIALPALLAAVVLAVLVSLLGPVAPAGAAAVAPERAAGLDAAGPVHLGDDAVRPRAASGSRASIAWRGSRLYYRETLPARWDWSLSTAVAKWNASGSTIRLVPTTSRSRAQVTVSYGDIGEAAGMATVGRTRGAYVELSSAYATADATNAHTRVEVMSVLAHELGHVLGFDHTTTACSLMGPVLDVAGCGAVSDDHPGAYGCRTIDAPLVSRLVRLYGGRARVAAAGWCLIDPLPGTLSDVAVGVSETGELVVTWRPPTATTAGAVVEVAHWNGDCTRPGDAVRELAAASDGRWARPAGSVGACVTATLVNRYGLASGRTSAVLNRAAAAVAVAEPGATSTP